ncbi:MAG: FAD-binding domain-containing protein, partial [Oscillatoria sp. PMC 1076.18]|nr:FAD-binding domain-containing protein [Oscillatoria sp. PMC 1076.18]
DLRVTDNDIIAKATATGDPVLPFFIIDSWFYEQPEMGAARVKFMFESLVELDQNLRRLGSQLYLLSGNSVKVLQQLTLELQNQGYIPKLHFNRDVQTEYGIERDRQILQFYQDLNLETYLGLNNFLQIIATPKSQWYQQYYTYQRQPLHSTPIRRSTTQLSLTVPQLTFTDLERTYPTYWNAGSRFFTGGETEAKKMLRSFLKYRFRGYHWKLSHPSLAQRGATSHLSPHLCWGTISTRQVYQQTKAKVEQLQNQPKEQFALKTYRDRLRWRDSFTQRLYNFPELVHTNCYPEFDRLYHDGDLTAQQQEYFTAWQQGKTGFPLVDASMRQLKDLGWMSFRMRAMCATFLTVNCGVSWQHGARHYMNYLVDGDLAINHWQWQMQAGITNPLSGTFRIYNPTKNLQEKDQKLDFVHYWIPELRGYNLAAILSEAYLAEGDYPAPMLDWRQTRLVNGKVISQLRTAVKQRLEAEGGEEYEQALKAKETVEKYWQVKDKQYQEYQQQVAE